MKTPFALLLGLCLISAACGSETPDLPPQSHESTTKSRSWGTLSEALRDGKTEARVDAVTIAEKRVYAVGAAAALDGEITIVDGEVWLTKVVDGRPVTTTLPTAAAATFLFSATVAHWQEIKVDDDIAPAQFEEFLARSARKAGLNPNVPFPFVVEGTLSPLSAHVIAGACPLRARMLGKEAESPPYETKMDRVDAQLIGFYASDQGGIMTHHGSATHTHVILNGPTKLTGHVEAVGIAKGARLRLPTAQK